MFVGMGCVGENYIWKSVSFEIILSTGTESAVIKPSWIFLYEKSLLDLAEFLNDWTKRLSGDLANKGMEENSVKLLNLTIPWVNYSMVGSLVWGGGGWRHPLELSPYRE
jgi:hypothetical protein